MPYRKAIGFKPVNRTYAIRIFSNAHKDEPKRDLIESPLYVKITRYYLDDITSEQESLQGLALKILQDFQSHKDNCDSLLVHCIFGKSRSPAVGIALNEIFKLGNDTRSLKEQYPQYNQYIYNMLKSVEKEL